MRTIKFRYTVVRSNGFIFKKEFTIQEIERGDAKAWLEINHVGSSDVVYRLQFTGLLDKNGKEIYDGDILHSYGELFSNFGQYPTGKYATSIYQVLWVKDGWGHKTLVSKTQVIGHESKGLAVMASLTDIIGNIYENPELLKKE